jgi:hypothetical protein
LNSQKYNKGSIKGDDDKLRFEILKNKVESKIVPNITIPNSLNDLLTQPDRKIKQTVLQAIIDSFSEELVPIIQSELNHAKKDLKTIIDTHRKNRIFKLVDEGNKLIAKPVLVEFMDECSLFYPEYLLYMKGHALCDYGYKKFFRCIEKITPEKIDPLEPITHILDNYQLIPKELLDIFLQLQKPSAYIPLQARATKLNERQIKKAEKREKKRRRILSEGSAETDMQPIVLSLPPKNRYSFHHPELSSVMPQKDEDDERHNKFEITSMEM